MFVKDSSSIRETVGTSSKLFNLATIGTIGVVYISMLEVKFYDYGKIN